VNDSSNRADATAAPILDEAQFKHPTEFFAHIVAMLTKPCR